MQRRHIVWLVIGVTAVSTSAVLIRAADDRGVSSLAIAFYRCALASAVLVPLALARHRGGARRPVPSPSLAARRRRRGARPALRHVDLVVVLHERRGEHGARAVDADLGRDRRAAHRGADLAPRLARDLGGDRGRGGDRDREQHAAGSNPALGDLLAVAGAIFAAVYVVIGRHVRAELSLVPYSASVYGVAAVLLGLAMVAIGHALPRVLHPGVGAVRSR